MLKSPCDRGASRLVLRPCGVVFDPPCYASLYWLWRLKTSTVYFLFSRSCGICSESAARCYVPLRQCMFMLQGRLKGHVVQTGLPRTAVYMIPCGTLFCCHGSKALLLPFCSRCAQRHKKPVDLAELSERSAAMRERLHVPFHSLAGSADEDETPRGVLEQAETELSGGAKTRHHP